MASVSTTVKNTIKKEELCLLKPTPSNAIFLTFDEVGEGRVELVDA